MTLPINQVLCGDCLEVMKEWSSNVIDMVMFSPPYYGLRDYGVEAQTVWGGDPKCEHEWGKDIWQHQRGQPQGQTAQVHHAKTMTTHIHQGNICSKCGAWRGQLGLEPTWQLYIEHMTLICSELKRVLKKSGSMYVVIGDTYATHTSKRSGQFGHDVKEGFDDVFTMNRPKQAGYQEKCLMGIPWRLAFNLIQDGWTLRNDIIWHKPNHMPSSVKDRLTNAYEHIFHLVKARKYYYDLDAIRIPHKNPKAMQDYYGESRVDKASRFRRRETQFQKVPLEAPHRASKDKVKPIKSENPSDVLKFKGDETKPAGRLAKSRETYRSLGLPEGHIGGKNPSDVIQYKSKYREEDYGQSLQQFTRTKMIEEARTQSRIDAKKLFPHDKRKQQDYINYIHDHLGHPKGANPSDYWSITTKPFPQAHFAVYPMKLCRRPILSSCPAQVCVKCGKPRIRITNRKGEIVQQWGERKKKPWFNDKREMPQKVIKEGIYETVGWSDCGCNAGFEAGIVLDPMCGSGTTLIVAQKLGRKWIGIDINRDYVEMAKARLRKECSQKLVKWQN